MDDRFPKLGMTYDQVRSRLLKDDKYKFMPRTAASLLRQAKLCEGESAALDIESEVKAKWDTNNHSTNRLGYSPLYAKSYETIKW